MEPPDKDQDTGEEFERGRAEMERGWRLRQQNVLPLPAAWNEGRFYGRALKGTQPLTALQRAGLFLLGIQGIGIPIIFLFLGRGSPSGAPFVSVLHHVFRGESVVWLPVYLIYMALGARLCWVALRARPATPRKDESSGDGG
ncbi:MAG TPA: hypothetical protein VMJ93_12080 [Verrucomicrobiae bacterium]|nr:hypothetical protein [Verrucomicrobiae bacterium]